MTRQKSTVLTVAPVRRHVKEAFRGVFVALRADIKHREGGATELANECEMNAVVLSHKLSPDYFDHSPTVEQLLTVIERGDCRRTVAAIAALVGQTTLTLPMGDPAPRSVVNSFMALMAKAGRFTAQGAEDLADLNIDSAERERQAATLDELIPAMVQYRALLRS